MPYLGQVPLTGNYNKLDSISSSFNGSTTTFNLTAGSVAMEPVVAPALLVSVNGVLQQPLTDYTISGSTITFTTAPASTDVCFIIIMGGETDIGTPSDLTVTSAKLSGNLTLPGKLTAAGDTAAGDNASIGYTSAEGLILTGQGSTNDVTIKNDADADVIKIPTGTTNVTIVGDLTITGDDLYMGTNTSGAALIADGTNFNPVVISGDIAINTSGVAAIGSGVIVVGDMAANSIDSAQYVDGSIDAAHYAAGSVDATALGADAVTAAKIGDNVINSEHYAAGSIDLEHMSSQSVDEDNLHISNSPTNGYMLTAQSGNAGGLTWAAASSGATSINGLSDALIESNSLYLGNDPSGTTDTASYNVAVGTTALDAITTGDNNTAVGYDALGVNTTGADNAAFGRLTLSSNTTGASNTAYGGESLKNNTTGTRNTAVGYNSLYGNSTGTDNTTVGYQALTNNQTGAYNTATGREALRDNTTAGYNSAFGSYALEENTTGAYNTAAGYEALTANTTAAYNTAFGVSALTANTTGTYNVAIGSYSLAANITGDNNTAVGRTSLLSTTGSNNTAVGQDALRLNASGSKNIGIGYGAGDAITTGANNTIIGDYAGTSGLDATVVIAAGTTERIKVTSTGLYVNTTLVTGANSVDSDQYVDGSIDTAHIADDQITLAKMASGTDGNIISYDASGNPVAIATGSDGQVLTSAGAGQPPAFEAAGGGGGSLTFLQSVDGAGQSTIDLTTGISASTYDGYLIIFNITASLDSRQLYFRTSADGGSSFDSGASDYNWFVNTIDTAPSNTVAFDQSDDEIQINGSRDVGYTGEERIYGHMMIVAPGLVERTTITGQGFYLDQNGNGNYFAFGGQRKTAEAVDGYQFLFSAGNIADGTVTMYGLKSS